MSENRLRKLYPLILNLLLQRASASCQKRLSPPFNRVCRTLLHFLSEMQSHATTPQAAVADRGKTVFRLGLAFVSEAAVLPRPNHSGDADIERIRTLAAPFEEGGCRVHMVRLEELFLRGQSQPGETGGERILSHTGHDSMADGAPGRTHEKSAGPSEEGQPHGGNFKESPATRAERLAAARERLQAVVGRVADATAQEDLVEMLRREALQQVTECACSFAPSICWH